MRSQMDTAFSLRSFTHYYLIHPNEAPKKWRRAAQLFSGLACVFLGFAHLLCYWHNRQVKWKRVKVSGTDGKVQELFLSKARLEKEKTPKSLWLLANYHQQDDGARAKALCERVIKESKDSSLKSRAKKLLGSLQSTIPASSEPVAPTSESIKNPLTKKQLTDLFEQLKQAKLSEVDKVLTKPAEHAQFERFLFTKSETIKDDLSGVEFEPLDSGKERPRYQDLFLFLQYSGNLKKIDSYLSKIPKEDTALHDATLNWIYKNANPEQAIRSLNEKNRALLKAHLDTLLKKYPDDSSVKEFIGKWYHHKLNTNYVKSPHEKAYLKNSPLAFTCLQKALLYGKSEDNQVALRSFDWGTITWLHISSIDRLNELFQSVAVDNKKNPEWLELPNFFLLVSDVRARDKSDTELSPAIQEFLEEKSKDFNTEILNVENLSIKQLNALVEIISDFPKEPIPFFDVVDNVSVREKPQGLPDFLKTSLKKIVLDNPLQKDQFRQICINSSDPDLYVEFLEAHLKTQTDTTSKGLILQELVSMRVPSEKLGEAWLLEVEKGFSIKNEIPQGIAHLEELNTLFKGKNLIVKMAFDKCQK